MKKEFILVLSILLSFISATGYCKKESGKVSLNSESVVSIENAHVKVRYDLLKGVYDIIDNDNDSRIIRDAYTQINSYSSKENYTHTSKKEDVNDVLGKGKKLTITSSKSGIPEIILEISLYDSKKFVVLNAGVINSSQKSIRLHYISPMKNAIAFKGNSFSNYRALDGYSGGSLGHLWPGHGHTTRLHNTSLSCENNLLVTFGNTVQNKKSLVVGGLSYHEFAKKAEAIRNIDHISTSIWCQDEVGKLVDANSEYIPNEKFYVNFKTNNPFDALEEYAHTLKTAQKINLSVYDFPTLCLWYAKPNNTNEGVQQMDTAIATGLLNYSRLAIRIVPDNYEENNINGWFDDEHWRKYKFYVPPYETSEKFGKAIIDRGGIPFQYFQSTKSSADYSEAHPSHCRFNDGSLRTLNTGVGWNIIGSGVYDITDPDFQDHMKNKYSNLYKSGFRGLMVDYPHLSWHEDGGFDDPYCTTAGFHRKYFQLIYDGLGGAESYVHERMRDSDVTLGVISSKRTEGDTWALSSDMIKSAALRWYKNRVCVNWDMDAKDYTKATPGNRDGVRTMYTMSYVVSGRLLLGHTLDNMPPEVRYDLTRTLPYHSAPQSARPIDAFEFKRCPEKFDFKIDDNWHQLTFYNGNVHAPQNISVQLDENTAFGGLGLNPAKQYHIYDFWNDAYIGKYSGDDKLIQQLRKGETRMMSIHKVEKHPQFISTNRHIMQGYVDMTAKPVWKSDELKGSSSVVGGETYSVIIATNGYGKPKSVKASKDASVEWEVMDKDLVKLNIDVETNDDVSWSVTF